MIWEETSLGREVKNRLKKVVSHEEYLFTFKLLSWHFKDSGNGLRLLLFLVHYVVILAFEPYHVKNCLQGLYSLLFSKR